MALAARRAAYAEEAAEVEVLYANLDKMKSLTKKIKASMGRLEGSGKVVQEAIGPLYGRTQALQTQNNNIDRVLEVIDRIREPLDMRNREEQILRAGPQKAGLQEYVASIDRTNQALRQLELSNLRSNQQAISELNSLVQVGVQQLEDVFRDVLCQDVQPVEPLGYITKGNAFPRISQNRASQLRTINTHICNFANDPSNDRRATPSAKIYADIRGQYLTSSLQNLSSACMSTARKVSADAIYKHGSNAISSYVAGIEGMFTAEYESICPVFSREEWGQVLTSTCDGSLAMFASTLRELNAHVRANLATDCFLAYEIIEIVSTTSLRLEEQTGELKDSMSEALKPVRETAKSSLSSLLGEIRSKIQQIPQLPGDGSAVPITMETMTRLQLMTSYLPPLSSIMTSLGDGGWSSAAPTSSSVTVPTLKSFDVGADGKKLFSHYAIDTFETLLSSLDGRAKTLLKGKGLQGVFIANNVVVMDRMIRNSDLAPLLGAAQPKLEAWKKKALSLYMDAWALPARDLQDSTHTNRGVRPPSTGQAVDSAAIVKQLSSKEKDTIKGKFDNFNSNFDGLVTKHKSFRMEKEVRQAFAKDIQRFVEQLYHRFWDRYHDIDKGKGKHVKYDKAQMSGIIAGLA